MKRIQLRVAAILLLVMAIAAPAAEVFINATAISESGAALAKGFYSIPGTGGTGLTHPPSTRGQSSEPVAMYLLLSYVAAPTPWLLNPPVLQEGSAETNMASFVIEEEGDWDVSARTTLTTSDFVAVPAGTYSNVVVLKTVVTGARCQPTNATSFVNGTRYLWLARGVGLVRMRYEHQNGKVTEAVLLSHNAKGNNEDFLPLQVSNRWTYAWKNDYRREAVIETWTTGPQPEDLGITQNPPTSRGEEEIKEVDPNNCTLDLAQDSWIRIPADSKKGFNFPYYLFVPRSLNSAAGTHLFVEPNNTGTTSDDFGVHERAAARLVKASYATQIARELGAPLLVPVFPRPATQWQAYTHSLDEDTLLIRSGPLGRIDLQLTRMVVDAQALLRRNRVKIEDRIFMHGYSASGVFVNRFAVLHPEMVRAVASGGINAIPIFPVKQWNSTELPFPVGIADLKQLTDIDFNREAYRQVWQYIYMGYLDRNDTTLSRDAFCEEHARLIRELIGAEMPKRWAASQSIYRELGVPAQCVTYNGCHHEIKSEMIDDIVEFFKANSGDKFVPIQPHEYPFVEFREIKTAHVRGVYWQGDHRIPDGIRKLFGNRTDFIMSIQEWMPGQDHQQLSTFREKAAFRFVLKAPGQTDVSVTEQHFQGTCSAGQGAFQGFVFRLPDSELEKLAPGVPYEVVPVEQREEYLWKVNEGVRLVRP